MFNSFHNNSLGFQCVQLSKCMWTLRFKCAQGWKSLAAVDEVTDILEVFSNHVCYNTQAMPVFQVLKFLYATLMNPRFLESCGPQPWSVHVIHPFRRTCETNMQTFMGFFWLIDVLKIFKTFNFCLCIYVWMYVAYVSVMRDILWNVSIGIGISTKLVGLMQGLKFWWIRRVIKYCMWLPHNPYNVFMLSWVLYAPSSIYHKALSGPQDNK
jgi:hypothetical protein